MTALRATAWRVRAWRVTASAWQQRTEWRPASRPIASDASYPGSESLGWYLRRCRGQFEEFPPTRCYDQVSL